MFQGKPDRNLYHVWERFKFLHRDCLHQQYTNEALTHTFLKGLDLNTKILLDSVAYAQALEKTYDEIYILLNKIK